MKLSSAFALVIFLAPTAWADNNGGLQKAKPHRHLIRWIADIAEPTMRAL
jgi:hypothetical protein